MYVVMCRGLCGRGALARPPHLHTLYAAWRAVLTAREMWTFAGFSAGVGFHPASMANELASTGPGPNRSGRSEEGREEMR